jgi:hypothetical protein
MGKGWVKASDLHIGDELRHILGQNVVLEKIDQEFGEFSVYNFEVEGLHNYYACDVLVHNCNEAPHAGRILRNEVGSVGKDVGQRISSQRAMRSTQALDSARREGFTRIQFPRGAGAARGAVPEGYVKVSRWTSEAEAQVWMREGATAIPSEIGANQRLYVTTHGAPKPGGTGPVRIDFEVPEAMLQGAGNTEWRQVMQPQANTPIYNVQINLP